jgi:hypothetical protein
MQRAHVLVSLEKAACEYHVHGRRELVEAFLLLANHENATLKHVLQTPSDRTFGPLADLLTSSTRPGVERLLLSYLEDPFAPLAAMQIMVRRRDVAFLRRLLRKIGAEPTPVVRLNLKRIESIPWMQVNFTLLDALGDHEQPGAVQLVALSGIPRQLAFECVAYMLRHGGLAGRRAAAKALAQFRGPGADDMVLRTLDDEDAHVRAAAAAQLRDRGVPGAIQRLLVMLDSPHEVEREAAHTGLGEFRFDRYLTLFDTLSSDARRATGLLVKQIDTHTLTALKNELIAAARSRRKRALEMCLAMGLVEESIAEIAALLRDDDQFLRIEAIRVLATCDCTTTRHALRDSLVDTHPLVQEAAELALTKLLQLVPAETPIPSSQSSFEPIAAAADQPLANVI